MLLDTLLEKQAVPDAVIRFGIRRLLAQRLREEQRRYDRDAYVRDLTTRPIAEETHAANQQHYEVPAEFFARCLGPHRKYSCCLYATGRETLAQAEAAMLELYAQRAQLRDGQQILELGCGWGSLSLYVAARWPRAKITAVSNSRSQRAFIEGEARRRGLKNLRVLTCDMNAFDTASGQFDRVVSVEMFEHMKNYAHLMANIARWLKPDGRLFVHIFTHARLSYHFVPRGADDWMARHFFSGGQMPAHDLLPQFQADLRLLNDWAVSGVHYQKTAEHWLANMDAHRAEILPILADTYGAGHEQKWWSYWRIFFMSCAELWGYAGGREWQVGHYLFGKPAGR